jgi:hypothetical protein
MDDTKTLERIRPRWMNTAGALHATHALVRSVCSKCGEEFREETADLVARYGSTAVMIGKRERCRLVGCDGSVSFKAARRYGLPFVPLLDAG